jgi:uroporphyrinogen III methyltransferase / synthase
VTRSGATGPGRVYLVGAGPGDPGLMTVRGLEVLRAADVVVYDRLVNPALVEEAPPHATRRFVGKRCGHHELEQDAINRLLMAEARRGHEVVRLKGGDPFVFGRGGEEAQSLAAAGIPFEVVPGVSSAVAVPAYAGIPLTHRSIASSFAVVTGHEEDGREGDRVDWARLAGAVDTLVVLMPARNLRRIASALLAHGLPAATPVALVRWGTTEAQETRVTSLDDAARGGAGALAPPLVAVIGQVVSLRETLRWFDAPGQDRAASGLPDARPPIAASAFS